MSVARDISARKSLTQAVYECLLAHRNRWVSAEALAQVGGFCAWRTRVSNARDLAAEFGDVILWNGQSRGSAFATDHVPDEVCILSRRARSSLACGHNAECDLYDPSSLLPSRSLPICPLKLPPPGSGQYAGRLLLRLNWRIGAIMTERRSRPRNRYRENRADSPHVYAWRWMGHLRTGGIMIREFFHDLTWAASRWLGLCQHSRLNVVRCQQVTFVYCSSCGRHLTVQKVRIA
jgi:hypothetical protein